MEVKKDSRIKDHYEQSQVDLFLDKYLYTHEVFSNFHRVKNWTLQLKGVNLLVSMPPFKLTDMIVDEKCAVQYVNRDIPTFVLELSTLIRPDYEKEIDGWFLNKDILTEYYMLLWPFAELDDDQKDEKYPSFSESQITRVDFMIVSRIAIKNMLKEKNFDEDKLRDYAARHRNLDYSDPENIEMLNNFKEIYKANKGFYIKKTTDPRIPETPVNLVVLRTELKKICVCSGTCKRDGIVMDK